MKALELRKMTKVKLQSRLAEKKAELINLEFEMKLGKVKNAHDKTKLKKEIARIMTIVNRGEYSQEEAKETVKKEVKKAEKKLPNKKIVKKTKK